MGKSRGRQKDRVGYRVVWEHDRHAKAVRLRARGWSWGQIAAELGYKSRSGAERAVERGLAGSMLIPGVRWVMRDRLDRYWGALDPLEPHVATGEVEDYLRVLQSVHIMSLRISAATGDATSLAGVGDVKGLLARRRPHLPVVDEAPRDQRLLMRGLAATFDMMPGKYANRSGVHKAVERDLRRQLFTAAVCYFEDELVELREVWHELDLAVRRRPIEGSVLLSAFAQLDDVLDRMTVFELPTDPSRLGRARRGLSSGRGSPNHGTAFPIGDPGFPTQRPVMVIP